MVRKTNVYPFAFNDIYLIINAGLNIPANVSMASGPETLIRAMAPPPEVAGAHIVVPFCTIIFYGAKVIEIYLARLSATKVLSGIGC
ncbi:MAG: hypothetical protein MZV63_07515 [Marinilabiliales bacterium]|nr:hypothetical protein [Marinilabiliales bacterium]